MRRVAHTAPGDIPDLECGIMDNMKASESLLQLLDYDKKGFISVEDILNTCFAIGLDLSVPDMREITDITPKLRADAFMRLLDGYNLTIDEVEKLVRYFTQTRRQRRPDRFEYLPKSSYLIKRLLSLCTPGSALFIEKFIPNFTPYEKGVFSITRSVLGSLCQVVLVFIYTCLVLTGTGTSSVSWKEVLSICLTSLPTGWGSQAARDSFSWSKEGTVRRFLWQRRLSILRHTRIHLKGGSMIDGMTCISRMFTSCETYGELKLLCQDTPLSFANRLKHTTRQRRRSSASDDLKELERGEELKQRGQMDEKYNIGVASWNKILPLVTALLLAGLPTVVRHLKGDSTLLGYTDGYDFAVDLMLMVFILLTIFFVSLVILKDARTEIAYCRGWCEFLLRSIQAEEFSRESIQIGESISFRLDSTDAVEGFAALYKFMSSYIFFNLDFHMAAFESLGLVCLASVILIFIGSVLDMEVDVWNTYPMASAILIWPVVLMGLLDIVKIDVLLTEDLSKYLRHQRRMNEKIARMGEKQLSPEERTELKKASEEIDFLIEEISDTHVTIRLLGKLKLNRGNMVRLASGMAVAIFTTIMRSAVKM